MRDGPPRAWLLLSPGDVPEGWHARTQQVLLVPLVEAEAAQVLASGTTDPVIGSDDAVLARLTARGHSNPVIARELGVSPRSVERRLTRLRRRFGVTSKTELAAVLAAKGF